MRAYVVGLFALSVCCAIVELFSPEGEGGGVARHIKWLSGICLLCVLWVPLSNLMAGGKQVPDRIFDAVEEWLDGGEDAQKEYDQYWKEQQEQLDLSYAGEAIREVLCRQFEQETSNITVGIETDETGERLALIRVGLSGKAIWLDTHQLEDFIQEMFGCESTIYLE